jgi:hypothetical protein
VTESACPFCCAALSDAFRATPARQAPRARLTRAALFALGTGVALTPACSPSSSGSPGTGDEQGDGSSEPATDGGATTTPEAGTPGSTDASATGSDGAGFEDGPTAQPLYGAVAYDAGGEPADDAGHTAQPLYGASIYDGSIGALYGGFVGH